MAYRNSSGCGAGGTILRGAGLAVALLAAGCASEPPPGPPPGRAPDGGPPPDGGPRGGGPPGGGRFAGRAALFISPSGEPFHGQPGQPYPVAVWFKGADADGDGKLTRDEFVADAARFFARLDANHDGVIDGFEVKAYETDIAPEIVTEQADPSGSNAGAPPQGGGQGAGGRGGGGRRGGGGGGGGRRGGGQGGGAPAGGGGNRGGGMGAQGAAPYDLLPDREPVASADLDLNGRITLKNFQARASQRFDRLDDKGQGYLLLAELPKTPVQKLVERRQERRQDGQRPPPSN